MMVAAKMVMPKPGTYPGGPVLILASASDPDAIRLTAALSEAGLASETASQAAHGLVLLCRKPPAAPAFAMAIVLDSVIGLSVEVLIRSIRALSGHARFPLVVIGNIPAALSDAAVLPDAAVLARPPEVAAICRLLLTDPQTWIIPDPTSTGASCELERLKFLEKQSPGSGRHLAKLVLADLDTVQNDLTQRLEVRDLTQLAESAHKIKGAMSFVGAGTLAQSLAVFEQAARRGDRAACHLEVAGILQAVVQVQSLLQTLAEHGALGHPIAGNSA